MKKDDRKRIDQLEIVTYFLCILMVSIFILIIFGKTEHTEDMNKVKENLNKIIQKLEKDVQ